MPRILPLRARPPPPLLLPLLLLLRLRLRRPLAGVKHVLRAPRRQLLSGTSLASAACEDWRLLRGKSRIIYFGLVA
jgi:hypothetical protein